MRHFTDQPERTSSHRAIQARLMCSCLMIVAAWPLRGTAQENSSISADQAATLAEIAAGFNHLFVGKAIACTIGGEDNSGTTTYYYPAPFERAPDGSYATKAFWTMVTRKKGEPDRVLQGDKTDRIRWQRGTSVYEVQYTNYTSRPDEILRHGSGFTVRTLQPVQGDINMIEWMRERNGQVVGLQRYLGLVSIVEWREVDVPPELQQVPDIKPLGFSSLSAPSGNRVN